MYKDSYAASTIAREVEPARSRGELEQPVWPSGAVVSVRAKHRRLVKWGRPATWPPAVTGAAPRRPNLLIAGGSGHVAQAFLQRLELRRTDFGRLVFLDPNEGVLSDRHLDHDKLDYEFVCWRLRFPEDTAYYHRLLRRHQIDIVLDVTDLDTMPILTATDAVGVSYVNTGLNDVKRGVADLVAALHPTREQERAAPHILSSGMNPGVVNIWVWDAFQRYGAPGEIVHFEYDTSVPVAGWRPIITWSRQEFLCETVWEPTGLVREGRLQMFPANSLQRREDLRPIMEPVARLSSYPRGLLVLHEENVELGQKLGASSRYIYAIHPKTMEHLDRLWRERGRVGINDLELGDNTSVPLTGSDTIGVCLDYPDKRVYYLHSLANNAVIGTNATCAQVAVGVDAALSALLTERLSPRIYFSSDLYGTVYRDAVFSGLHVEHFVFEKAVGTLALQRHLPATRRRFTHAQECAAA
jgi:hypothetical protein